MSLPGRAAGTSCPAPRATPGIPGRTVLPGSAICFVGRAEHVHGLTTRPVGGHRAGGGGGLDRSGWRSALLGHPERFFS